MCEARSKTQHAHDYSPNEHRAAQLFVVFRKNKDEEMCIRDRLHAALEPCNDQRT